MKKILALVLCAIMMFALAIPAMAVIDITANKTAIAIDGVREEAYAGPLDIAAPNRNDVGEFTNAEGAATGKVWTAWEGSNLYFYIEVYDKTPNIDDFNAESIELFLDWNAGRGEADEATDETPFWQIRVSPVEPETLGGYSRTDDGANWSTSDFEDLTEWKLIPIDGNYANGYIAEIKVGAPAVSSLSEGKQIPFDVQVCDNTQGEGRDGQMFLDHVGEGIDDNCRWNTASALQGLITLGGAYVAPTVDAEPDVPEVGGDDVVVTIPEVQPPVTSPKTGDSAIILLALGIALAVSFTVVKRTRKNKA